MKSTKTPIRRAAHIHLLRPKRSKRLLISVDHESCSFSEHAPLITQTSSLRRWDYQDRRCTRFYFIKNSSNLRISNRMQYTRFYQKQGTIEYKCNTQTKQSRNRPRPKSSKNHTRLRTIPPTTRRSIKESSSPNCPRDLLRNPRIT